MKLLIFELEVTGHHPGYLRHLLRYWQEATIHLVFVVSPELAVRHPALVQMSTCAQVTWQPITQSELHWYQTSKRSLVRRSWTEWRLYNRYAKKMQADQGLIMYIDRFQLPLALRLLGPCQTSGIFFRPSFHYRQHTESKPTAKERLKIRREEWFWRSALHHPQLKTLFCLDPLAVAPLRALGGHSAVIPLPDPVEIYPQPADVATSLRQKLGIEPTRRVLLLFGMIDQRKGIYQVLAALQQLPTAEQAQVALLLVGPLSTSDKATIEATVAALTHATVVQIVVCDQFVADEQIQQYFAVADLILALYQQHVGMSAILVRAAAAGKPVLASDYGLMGEVVRRHRLGMVVDSASPAAIAQVLSSLPTKQIPDFDRHAAAQFAMSNAPVRFVQTLTQRLIAKES